MWKPKGCIGESPLIVMSVEEIRDFVVRVLDDKKAVNVVVMDVRQSTDITDFMVFASGNSSRQVKALANELVEHSKASGKEVLGVEGMDAAEWVLVDLLDVVRRESLVE